MRNVVHERVIGLEIKTFSVLRKQSFSTYVFHFSFMFFFFFLRREYDTKSPSPDTEHALSREGFSQRLQLVALFLAGQVMCEGGILSNVAHTENLTRSRMPSGFSDPAAACWTHFMSFSNKHNCCAS